MRQKKCCICSKCCQIKISSYSSYFSERMVKSLRKTSLNIEILSVVAQVQRGKAWLFHLCPGVGSKRSYVHFCPFRHAQQCRWHSSSARKRTSGLVDTHWNPAKTSQLTYSAKALFVRREVLVVTKVDVTAYDFFSMKSGYISSWFTLYFTNCSGSAGLHMVHR